MVGRIDYQNAGSLMQSIAGPSATMKLFILTRAHMTQLGSSIKMDALILQSWLLNRGFLVRVAGTYSYSSSYYDRD